MFIVNICGVYVATLNYGGKGYYKSAKTRMDAISGVLAIAANQ